MKILSAQEAEKIHGGKFWGTSCTYDGGAPSIDDNGNVYCTYNCTYSVLGVVVSHSTQAGGCPSLAD